MFHMLGLSKLCLRPRTLETAGKAGAGVPGLMALPGVAFLQMEGRELRQNKKDDDSLYCNGLNRTRNISQVCPEFRARGAAMKRLRGGNESRDLPLSSRDGMGSKP